MKGRGLAVGAIVLAVVVLVLGLVLQNPGGLLKQLRAEPVR